MVHKTGKLFIVYGPSGAGKSTLLAEILKTMPILTPVITYTTRVARVNEIHAKDYFFITHDEFTFKQTQNHFIHVTSYLNNWYGASKDIVKDLEAGKNLIAIFDREGALEVKNSIPGSVLIWITAPINELEKRLRNRYASNSELLAIRLAQVQEDIKDEQHKPLAHYMIVNEDLESAIKELETIIKTSL